MKELLDRLDGLMALHVSRGEAKEAARARNISTWAFSTGKIHSYKTRAVYQEHSMHFVTWARETYGLKQLALIDARVGELTSAYLQARLDEGKSAYTLQTIRCALRLVFSDRTLMQEVPLPQRSRATITRSRGPKASDRHFNPNNWPHLIHFLQATGLRRDEVTMLRAGAIIAHDPSPHSPSYGQTIVLVRSGKGGKARTVPVLAGHEPHVLALKEGKADQERVFARIPGHLDVHSYRRDYAQALYLQHASPLHHHLPHKDGRLLRRDYDLAAAAHVTHALGHTRLDIVLLHYLR